VPEALATFRSAVAEARLAAGPDDPSLFNHEEDLAIALQVAGQTDSAIAIQRRLLDARIRVFGPEHPDVAFGYYNLARTLTRAGRFGEGLPLFQRCVEVREKALGREHYLVGFALHSYAVATAQSGDLRTSEQRFERAAAILGAALPGQLMAQDAWEGLAIVRTMLGKNAGALDALEAAEHAGYRRPERLEQPPFNKLAGDPRYRALVDKMKHPA
jgi:tetratricopeptide (TPR) repeat protein